MIDNGLYVDKEVVKHSQFTAFTLAVGTTTLIAPAAAKRCRLHILTDGSNAVDIGQQNPIDPNRRIRVATSYVQIILDKEDYGGMLQGNLFATAVLGTPVVSVIDTVEE